MILNEIISNTKEIIKKQKSEMPEEILGRACALSPFFPRDVIEALRSTPSAPLKIIAEVKQASPSRGIIRENFDPIPIALAYQKGGASAISVLTEPKWFKGKLDFLSLIRRHTNLPLMRKDFIIDRYQLLEALVYGADFVLLIARVLSQKELKALLEQARNLGMRALVEIIDKADLTKAIVAGAEIIGINHRNLDSFEMDMTLSERLIPLIPSGKIIVAESGLRSHEQLKHLSALGVDAFLIGEHFMRQDDITLAVERILSN
ncbi:MAG: indole-3-glycerol phosphate synthase TrpC [Helicobacteraceae bacterium]|nr:indole-3-glycerol phosphate synthase TrpC [Helicobacteraceae bacterium]